MQASISNFILAVITLDPALTGGGGAPVFVARNQEEQDRIATYLARITAGVVHDLENGVYILVKH